MKEQTDNQFDLQAAKTLKWVRDIGTNLTAARAPEMSAEGRVSLVTDCKRILVTLKRDLEELSHILQGDRE